MDDLSTLLPPRDGEPNRVTAACNWKEGKNGGYVWHWQRGRIHTLRSTPPKLMFKGSDTAPWRNLLDAPFELSTMLRELARDDLVTAGLAKRQDGPRDERPLPGQYREHRRAAMRRFFADVPTTTTTALREGWRRGSWPLFRFLGTTPEAHELLATADGATLCWGLANLHFFLKGEAASHALRRARRQLGKKRHEVLPLFQVPATKAALKALGRVPRRDVDVSALRHVRDILQTEALWERAKHLPVWNSVILDLFTSTPPALLPQLSPGFLMALSMLSEAEQDQGGSHRVPWLLRDTVNLLQQVGQPLPVFTSVTHLQAVHDDAMHTAQVMTSPWYSAAPFPPLPIVLSARELQFIEPLVDSAALIAEGKAMHHCLGTLDHHHLAAADGDFYAFALTKPERFTVAVIREDASSPWSFYDVKGPMNGQVSSAAQEIAEALLQRFNRVTR